MVVRVQDVYKSYGQVHILKGINLEVNRSEIISIVGASGAGKTTLLQIIGTLDKSDKGKVELDGTAVELMCGSKLAAFRNKHIGFIFQFHHLLPEFTAIENVCIPGMIAGTAGDLLNKRASELLDYLGLSSRIHHKPSQLSGGEQQRVAVARALINNPSVVLADEPSGNLDSSSAAELHKLFFRLRAEFGQTFIIVTHNEELAGMADRKLQMKDGVFTGA
jgi:lipoprotein-releasing system ATP-binding protein